MRFQSLTLLFSSLIFASTAMAATEKSVVFSNGKESSITVTAAEYQAGVRKAVFIFSSKDNMSGGFIANNILAPAGSKVQVTFKTVSASASPSSVGSNANFSQIMQVYYNGKMQKSVTIGGSSSGGENNSGGGDTGGALVDTCNYNVSKQDLDYIIAYDSTHDRYFVNKTRAEVCTMIFGDWENYAGNIGNGGGNSGGGSGGGFTGTGIYLTAPMFIDACTKKTKIVGRMVVDLSGVDPSVFATDQVISSAITVRKEETLTGVYKVSGDGGVVPYPLILTELAHGLTKPLVQTWTKGVLKSTQSLNIGKYYMQFAVSHVRRTGRKQTVVMTNGVDNASSVCVMFGGSRQQFGGYK